MSTQLPMFPLLAVTLKIRWEELFGKTCRDTTEEERRQRWAQWLSLARAHDEETADWWDSHDGCVDEGKRCKHLDGSWCKLVGLPCSVNPYLTFKHGEIGMACMGAGFQAEEEAKP